MDEITLLGGSELFSAFDQAVLARIVQDARRVECERNFVIFEEGPVRQD